MAITYVGGITGSGLNANYNVSLTALTGGLASSPSEGDLVIVNFATGSTIDRDLNIVTTGYTRFINLYANDTYDANLFASYKFMGSTPDTLVTIPSSVSSTNMATCEVQVWRGVDPNVFDVTTTTATGIDTKLPTPPAITPTTSGSVILCGAAAAVENTGTAVYTASQLSNFLTILQTGGTYSSLSGIGSYAWTSGAFTPSQWTATGDSTNFSWCAYTLALRPLATVTNFQINIGDTWKTVESIQINIGDVWKDVTDVQINIGDTWKTIY